MSDINGLINWIEPGLPPKNFGRYGINTESLLLRAIAYGDEEELDKILKFSAFDCDSRITVHGERQALLSLAIKSHQAGCGMQTIFNIYVLRGIKTFAFLQCESFARPAATCRQTTLMISLRS